MNSRTWISGITVLVSLSLIAYSLLVLYHEYDDAVHGGLNHTANANATSSICLKLAKHKATEARDGIIAGITVNTLLIAVLVFVSVRCIDTFKCFFCIDDCLPRRVKMACNILAGVLLVVTLVAAAVLLSKIDESCKELTSALILLIISLIFFGIAVCVCSCDKDAISSDNNTHQDLLDDVDLN